jgi:hypothetical protein
LSPFALAALEFSYLLRRELVGDVTPDGLAALQSS